MGNLHLTAPIYLLTGSEPCYRCGKNVPVVALACRTFEDEDDPSCSADDADSEPVLVHDVSSMPDSLLKMVRDIHPHYEKRRSRMAGSDYFMNICPHCDAHFGDFFLFSEPDGAFFPTDDEAGAAITLRKLSIEGRVEIEGSYSMGGGAEIFAKGRAI